MRVWVSEWAWRLQCRLGFWRDTVLSVCVFVSVCSFVVWVAALIVDLTDYREHTIKPGGEKPSPAQWRTREQDLTRKSSMISPLINSTAPHRSDSGLERNYSVNRERTHKYKLTVKGRDGQRRVGDNVSWVDSFWFILISATVSNCWVRYKMFITGPTMIVFRLKYPPSWLQIKLIALW